MIEPPDARTKLLADTVHGDWAGGRVADFSRQAAAHARRCRRLRRGLQAVGATACAAIALAVFYPRQPLPFHFSAKIPEQKKPAYEIISDEELLAGLRDRPLLMLKKENGAREFVLLDR